MLKVTVAEVADGVKQMGVDLSAQLMSAIRP